MWGLLTEDIPRESMGRHQIGDSSHFGSEGRLGKEITDWDARIEREGAARLDAKETNQGKRTDITCENCTSDSTV